jgi:biotin carboxyl carrier protein
VILAPAVGVFHPVDDTHQADGSEAAEGKVVTAGQVVGVVEASGRRLPVRSAFTGLLVAMMALPGERVREGQPVAWLRVS